MKRRQERRQRDIQEAANRAVFTRTNLTEALQEVLRSTSGLRLYVNNMVIDGLKDSCEITLNGYWPGERYFLWEVEQVQKALGANYDVVGKVLLTVEHATFATAVALHLSSTTFASPYPSEYDRVWRKVRTEKDLEGWPHHPNPEHSYISVTLRK